MIAARHPVHRRAEHGAARIHQDVVEREQRRPSAGLWPPGGDQTLAHLAGRVDVAEAQQPAELCVIFGGVEVPGQHDRRIAGRWQRGELGSPARGRGQVPGRHGRMRVHADQLHGLSRRQLEPGRGLRGVAGPDHQPVAQRMTGVDAAAAIPVLLDVEHLVRQQFAQPGQLQPGDGVAGELLHEQHVSAGPADQADQALPRSPAVLQVDREHGQLGTGCSGRPARDRAGNHHRGQGRGSERGRRRRAPASQRERGHPGGRGRLRRKGQQRHGDPLQRAEAVSGRQAGRRPAGDAARDGPLEARGRHGLIVACSERELVR
jgi:hypothetical protein